MSAEKCASKANCGGRQSFSPAKHARLEKLFEHTTVKSLKPKDFDYVTELLAQCVLGDPGNTKYIRAFLENLRNKYGNNKKGASLAQLKTRGARSALKIALNQGQWDEAIKHGLKVLTINPWNILTLCNMATAAKQAGDQRSELCYLKAAIMATPKDPACNRLMAVAMKERGLIDQAIALWHRVEELLPEDAEAKQAIADLMLNKAESSGNFDVPADDDTVTKKLRFKAEQREEAARKEKIQKSVDEGSSNVDHYLELAQIYIREERYKDAEGLLSRACDISENDPDIQDRWDDAQLRNLRQKISVAEDATVKERLRQEYFNKDLEVCSRRVERYPNNLRFRFDLGYRYMMARRYPEAIEELQIAQNDSARTGVALLALGQCFQHLKHHVLAIDHYKSAIKEISDIDADNKKLALYLGGRLALALNDIDTAESFLKRLASLDFTYKECETLLGKIDKLRELSGNVASSSPLKNGNLV